MTFSLSEEQNLLRDSVRKWVKDNYEFDKRRRQLRAHDGFDPAHWRAMAELGWLALPFVEEDGGLGGSLRDVALVLEEFGKGLVVEPYLASVVMAGGVIRRAGSAAQRAALIAGIADGSRQAALACYETGGRFSLEHVATRAMREGDGWVLEGSKIAVLNGDAADTIVVAARSSGECNDRDGISLFVVDATAAGLSRRAWTGFDAFRAAELRLDRVRVGADALLGEEGRGYVVLADVIDEAIVAVCAEAVGIMEMLYKATVEYARTRKQFGVPIGSFQALQHRMVDMFIYHEQAQPMLASTVASMGHADANLRRAAASALKAYCGKAGRYIGQQAVQIHGGMGMTDELNIGHAFKRLTAIDILFGNEDFHVRRFAELA